MLKLCALLFSAAMLASPADAQDSPSSDPEQTARPVAVEISDAYAMRAKIHKVASFATLPLVGTEALLGRSVYNDPSTNGANKNAHIVVGTALTGLFAVNTVTGVWNLWEGRHDPQHRTLRMIHGIVMLGADAGFAAAYATAPGGRNLLTTQRDTHRAVALTSLGVAAGGYLMMLVGNR